jgi:hypothetical protein
MGDDHGEAGAGVELLERLRESSRAAINRERASIGRLIFCRLRLLSDGTGSIEAEGEDQKTKGGAAEHIVSHLAKLLREDAKKLGVRNGYHEGKTL